MYCFSIRNLYLLGKEVVVPVFDLIGKGGGASYLVLLI